MNRTIAALVSAVIALALNTTAPRLTLAWGHEVVALIAQAHLDVPVRRKVTALLKANTDPLTAHDIASEATWADKLRDSNENGARQKTSQWHFVDTEVADPDLDQACFGHPPVPPSKRASEGPEQDCVVDKVEEFSAELANPATKPEEQIVALKFLLHFMGDLHQPLHASDDHDRGGNEKRVTAAGFKAGNLHHYWDTVFVEQLGPNASRIASDLIGHISERDAKTWAQGRPSDWARETFVVGKNDAYGHLPAPNARGAFPLSGDYIRLATQDVATQLGKVGVRLAFVLNETLGHP